MLLYREGHMSFDRVIITYIIQAVLQIAWGVVCYFYSPHNIILVAVSVALLVYTVASKFFQDKELIVTRLYLATWVIPAAYLAFASMANIMHFYTLAGVPQAQLPLQGTSHEYIVALKNYFIAQLIPPVFRCVRWVLK